MRIQAKFPWYQCFANLKLQPDPATNQTAYANSSTDLDLSLLKSAVGKATSDNLRALSPLTEDEDNELALNDVGC